MLALLGSIIPASPRGTACRLNSKGGLAHWTKILSSLLSASNAVFETLSPNFSCNRPARICFRDIQVNSRPMGPEKCDRRGLACTPCLQKKSGRPLVRTSQTIINFPSSESPATSAHSLPFALQLKPKRALGAMIAAGRSCEAAVRSVHSLMKNV